MLKSIKTILIKLNKLIVSKKNIFIMGCGRSGTTYLLTLMSSYKDTYTLVDDASVPGEDHFDRFNNINSTKKNRVIKRSSDSYDYATKIPNQIFILWLVRHPLDVTSSTLYYQGTTHSSYISAERWIREANALKQMIASKQKNILIIKYEDLINKPDKIQLEIASFCSLKINNLFRNNHLTFTASQDISETMNGIRPPDPSSIGRWKKEEYIHRSKQIWNELGDTGEWFCDYFDYDQEEINQLTKSV